MERARAAKRGRDWIDFASTLACYLRADAMRDYLDRIVAEYSLADRLLEHRWVGASAMFYASICPLIEAWETTLRPSSNRIDPRVDAILTSPLRNVVFDFRNSVLHFARYNDKRVIELLSHNMDVDAWARQFHAAIGDHLNTWRDELVADGNRTAKLS